MATKENSANWVDIDVTSAKRWLCNQPEPRNLDEKWHQIKKSNFQSFRFLIWQWVRERVIRGAMKEIFKGISYLCNLWITIRWKDSHLLRSVFIWFHFQTQTEFPTQRRCQRTFSPFLFILSLSCQTICQVSRGDYYMWMSLSSYLMLWVQPIQFEFSVPTPGAARAARHAGRPSLQSTPLIFSGRSYLSTISGPQRRKPKEANAKNKWSDVADY